MLRTMAAFLMVFSLLSLLVHLYALMLLLALAALFLLAADLLVAYFAKNPRSSKIRGEPLL
jgi:hypothetical protein